MHWSAYVLIPAVLTSVVGVLLVNRSERKRWQEQRRRTRREAGLNDD